MSSSPVSPSPPTATGAGGKALALHDGIRGGEGTPCYISFPGKYQDDWNNLVGWVELFGELSKRDKAFEPLFSTACIFLPAGDADTGKHAKNTFDRFDGDERDRPCWCHKLYGGTAPWGCLWFQKWRGQLEEAIRRKQDLVVVYKRKEADMGDRATWDDFPQPFDPHLVGLGGSQRGEVAFAKKILQGKPFKKKDVDKVAKEVKKTLYHRLDSFLNREDGAGRFGAAIDACAAARIGIRDLEIDDVDLNRQRASDLFVGISRLGGLRDVSLSEIRFGEEPAGLELGKSLRSLVKLDCIHIGCTTLSIEAGKELGKSIRCLRQLTQLTVAKVNLGGKDACLEFAKSLYHLKRLSKLEFQSLDLSVQEVGVEFVKSVKNLTKLRELTLFEVALSSEAAGKELAKSIGLLTSLTSLDLWKVSLGGEAAGVELGGAVGNLTKLEYLRLRELDLGSKAAGLLLCASIGRLATLDYLHLEAMDLCQEAALELVKSIGSLTQISAMDLRSLHLGEEAQREIEEICRSGSKQAPRF